MSGSSKMALPAAAAVLPVKQRRCHFFRRRRETLPAFAIASAALISSLLIPSCVISTEGSPGTAPQLPLDPVIEKRTRDEKPATRGPRQVSARHILISYRGASRAAPYITRSKKEAQALAQSLRERAVGGEDFSELAKQHSDDRGSAAAGGDLGQFRREQMVPAFSQAAFSLKPGEIAEVVETEFGFHVIQRTK